MRLAMLYDVPVRHDAAGLHTHRSYGVYVDALAPYFTHVALVAPVPGIRSTAGLDYRLTAPGLGLVPLPHFDRWTRSLPAMVHTAVVLMARRSAWDILYVRMPCPLALPACTLAKALRRPVVMHVVGDLMAQMAEYPPGIRTAARAAGRAFERWTARTARYALTVAQGDALAAGCAAAGGSAASVIESTVSCDDLWLREAKPLGDPIRVLYVGALLEKKGIAHLLAAMASLGAGLRLRLEIVGRGPEESRLRSLAQRLGIEDRVRFAGSVGDGAALRQHYRAADVFVVPSLAEGVPRVLIEAMAQSVPVVATAVGGIPGVVRQRWNGLLVEPGSPAALAAGLHEMAVDAGLRARVVKNGMDTARRLTREAHAAEVVRLLDAYLATRFPAYAQPGQILASRSGAVERTMRQ